MRFYGVRILCLRLFVIVKCLMCGEFFYVGFGGGWFVSECENCVIFYYWIGLNF